MDMTVVLIHHRHGTNVSLAENEEAAVYAVANYCLDWWGDLEDRGEAEEPPSNPQDIIDLYFSLMDDGNYEIVIGHHLEQDQRVQLEEARTQFDQKLADLRAAITERVEGDD